MILSLTTLAAGALSIVASREASPLPNYQLHILHTRPHPKPADGRGS